MLPEPPLYFSERSTCGGFVGTMLTTSLNPLDQARVQQLPITGFLNKPLTREKVTALLQEHFAAR